MFSFYCLISFNGRVCVCVSRSSFDETHRQKVGADGHHAGESEAVHPTAGASAPRQRRSPNPAAAHARYSHTYTLVKVITDQLVNCWKIIVKEVHGATSEFPSPE